MSNWAKTTVIISKGQYLRSNMVTIEARLWFNDLAHLWLQCYWTIWVCLSLFQTTIEHPDQYHSGWMDAMRCMSGYLWSLVCKEHLIVLLNNLLLIILIFSAEREYWLCDGACSEIVSVLHQNEGGMDFPIPPEFWWSTDNLSASIFWQGVDQKILPCGQGRIDSVKINPSLLMMTDWWICVVNFKSDCAILKSTKLCSWDTDQTCANSL